MKNLHIDVNVKHDTAGKVEISLSEYEDMKSQISELKTEVKKLKKAKNFFYRHQVIVKTMSSDGGRVESYENEDLVDDEAIIKLTSEIKRLDNELLIK